VSAESERVSLRRFWNQETGATCDPESLRDLLVTNCRTGREGPWFGPRMLTALIDCTAVTDADTLHLGMHGGPCPHQIRVIIARKDNRQSTYNALRARAR
jgi:hypothetical protein